MPLSIRPAPYIVPSYSLTGDLLAYLQCGLQYRYQNRGALPPSKPVQLWFGQFIHGTLEEAFRVWMADREPFPWTAEQIDPLVLRIIERLEARGMAFQRFTLLGIAIERAYVAINELGPMLFPLIAEAEVKLQGIRQLPEGAETSRQSRYYEVAGVVDVLTSVTVDNAPAGNALVEMLGDAAAGDYEVIVDYKGMGRPCTHGGESETWKHHQWQVQTYSWLRSQQEDAHRVRCGLLIYINELVPSAEDMSSLYEQVIDARPPRTDVVPTGADLQAIRNWPRDRARWRRASEDWTQRVREWWSEGREQGEAFPRMPEPPSALSVDFRRSRSLRIVEVAPATVVESLAEFDHVVAEIEGSVFDEVRGTVIPEAWEATPRESTCTVCDFKKFCPADHTYAGAPEAP